MKRLLKWIFWLLVLACFAFAVYLAGALWQAERRETRIANDYAPQTGQYVQADDVKLFVHQAGPAHGQAVVLIHGPAAWGKTWASSIEALATKGYRVYAIDLPPFGYSQRPLSADYSKPAQARRVVAALHALTVSSAVLVGHSFSGGAAVETALQAPDLVRGIILVNAALGIRESTAIEPPGKLGEALHSALDFRPLRRGVAAAFLTDPSFTQYLIGAVVATPGPVTDTAVAVYREPMYLQGTTQAVSDWLPWLVAPPFPAPSEDPETYAKLATPMRLIWGEADRIAPLAQAENISRLNRNAPITPLAGVGHIPQLENPEQFNEALLQHVRALHTTP